MRRGLLDRRFVLRGMAAGGASVAIPLPRLAAMLDGNGIAWADGTSLPRRFAGWFFGNGVSPPVWRPAKEGEGDTWELREQLLPLKEVKSHLTVVTGLGQQYDESTMPPGCTPDPNNPASDAKCRYV